MGYKWLYRHIASELQAAGDVFGDWEREVLVCSNVAAIATLTDGTIGVRAL